MPKPKLIFMGTPEFAKTILEFLHQTQAYEIAMVVAQPDKPAGRGQHLTAPPVAEFAKANALPLIQPEKIRNAQILEQLANLKADFLLVAAYGKILPSSLLSIAKYPPLNVHASLLPRWRGASPIQACLLAGDVVTGVSIMQVEEGLDSGVVYKKVVTPIEALDSSETLFVKLASLGAQALHQVLQEFLENQAVGEKQEESLVTHAGKISKESAVIDWNKSAKTLFNEIRAYNPWPVSQTQLQGKRLKVYFSELTQDASQAGHIGEILHLSPKGWTVATAQGTILIQDVQLEGKKRMSAFDLANGLRLKAGEKLG